jgi:DNA replication and repair protein RecF
MEHQESHKKAEAEARACLSGPHKDDLEVLINERPVKKYGSQGQTRTAALSMKLAEREIHYNSIGEYPVLLLDDVLSELDKNRQDFVLNCILEGQVFITCCEDSRLSSLHAGKLFCLEKGIIK